MKNRLVITISDHKGTKSYNLHRVVKKFLLFFVLFIVISLGASFVFIGYLHDEIANVEQSKKDLEISKTKILKSKEVEIAKLVQKEQELITQNKINALKIEDTLKDIKALSSTLEEIEQIIGIDQKNEESDPLKRVQVAKLTSIEKMRLLTLIPNGSPLKDIKVTASFGNRLHPITKIKQFHRGIDLRAKRATKVFATADGVVRYVQSRDKGDFGRMVIISHNLGFETVYAHLKKTKVKIGEIVLKGDLIALSGSSGRSTGPHLHYETKFAGRYLNPYRFIKWDLKNFDSILKKEKKVPWQSLITLIQRQIEQLQVQ